MGDNRGKLLLIPHMSLAEMLILKVPAPKDEPVPDRMISHNGTETRPILLREAAVGNFAQWAKA